MSAKRAAHGATRPAYPYDQAWLDYVNAWCEREGRGSQARLAEAAGIAPGTLSQMLKGPPGHGSVAVPAINKLVGLPPPRFASGSGDEGNLGIQVEATLALIDDPEEAAAFREMVEGLIKHGRRVADRSRKRAR